MAKGGDVLSMLIPTGGWVIVGDDFDSIRYDEGVSPITKKQFEDGFAAYDAWKSEQEAKAVTAKESAIAKLNALGLTQEDIVALLA
jgi:hypothetical protein